MTQCILLISVLVWHTADVQHVVAPAQRHRTLNLRSSGRGRAGGGRGGEGVKSSSDKVRIETLT